MRDSGSVFGATLIDIFILGILLVLVDLILSLFVGYRVGFLADLEAEITVGDRISEILLFVIVFLYFTIMESSSKQATVGKIALNLKVTDNSGERISFLRAVARQLSKIVSFFGFFDWFFDDWLDQEKTRIA